MNPEDNITIINRNGRELFCTVTIPPSEAKAPIVILLHGFKGFRNWGFFPFSAQEIARAGAMVIRLDFALNGMRGTNSSVISTEDFASNTISHEVDDVHDLINALQNNAEFASLRESWDRHIQFVGHSRGGAITQIAARELIERTDVVVGPSVVWNSIGSGDRWTQRQRDLWRSVGYMEVENTRTGQVLRLNSSFLDDLAMNSDRLSLVTAATAVQDRMSYIHAELDMTVNINEAKELLRASGSSARLKIIEGSTHTFGMTHPVEHITHSFARVMELTTEHLFA